MIRIDWLIIVDFVTCCAIIFHRTEIYCGDLNTRIISLVKLDRWKCFFCGKWKNLLMWTAFFFKTWNLRSISSGRSRSPGRIFISINAKYIHRSSIAEMIYLNSVWKKRDRHKSSMKILLKCMISWFCCHWNWNYRSMKISSLQYLHIWVI